MVDIARDPRWGRIVEGSGEEPYLGSAMAAARVRGFQGPRLSDSASMLATAKHFAGYGASEGGRDYATSELSERTFWSTYLPPFRAAIDAGVGSVMPTSTCRTACTRIAFARARDNAQLRDEIDAATRRVLRVKYELALFSDPSHGASEEKAARLTLTSANRAAARAAAREPQAQNRNATLMLSPPALFDAVASAFRYSPSAKVCVSSSAIGAAPLAISAAASANAPFPALACTGEP
jgi:beta-glucosidase-like glycosyl hydrolase